jgi:hypothetical protein
MKTLNYVDGILSMFWTLGKQQRMDAIRKASLMEVTTKLTGLKAYREQIWVWEWELECQDGTSNQDDDEEPDNGNLVPGCKWDDDIPDEDLKLAGKHTSGSPSKQKRIKQRSSTARSHMYSANSPPKENDITNLVKEVKEALQDMALSMTNLAQVTQGNQGRTKTTDRGPRF